MPSRLRAWLRAAELVLAIGSIALVASLFSTVTGPTLPEFLIFLLPGLLATATIAGSFLDGRRVVSIAVGGLGVLTLGLVAWSGYTLYAVETGGVFFGGLFVIVSGGLLAAAVVFRFALRQIDVLG